MGRPSRDKGKRGEREVVEVFRDAGAYKAKRTAPLQAAGVDHGEADVYVGDELHVEVKRQEVLRLPLWLRQLDHDTPEGRYGVLVYRRSREPWRAVVGLELIGELAGRAGETPTPLRSESRIVPQTGRVTVDLVELAGLLVEAGMVA